MITEIIQICAKCKEENPKCAICKEEIVADGKGHNCTYGDHICNICFNV